MNSKLLNYKKKYIVTSFIHLQKKNIRKKIWICSISGRIRIRYPGSGSASKWSGSETLICIQRKRLRYKRNKTDSLSDKYESIWLIFYIDFFSFETIQMALRNKNDWWPIFYFVWTLFCCKIRITRLLLLKRSWVALCRRLSGSMKTQNVTFLLHKYKAIRRTEVLSLLFFSIFLL